MRPVKVLLQKEMEASKRQCVFAVILSLLATCVCDQSQPTVEQCTPVDEAALSCNFHNNFCGWNNTQDDDFDWKLPSSYIGSPHYITAESDYAGGQARLESPWLCPSGYNFTSLSFYYYMGQDDGKCRLSVFIRTPSGSTNFVTKNSHNAVQFLVVGPTFINCPDSPFKIIFEAEKLTEGRCGLWAAGIQIDDINVSIVQHAPPSSSIRPCPSPSTTGQPTIPDTMPTPTATTNDYHSSSDDMSSPTSTQSLPNSGHSASSTNSLVTSVSTEVKDSTLSAKTSISTEGGDAPSGTTVITGEFDSQTGDKDGGSLGGGAVAGIVVAVVAVIVIVIVIVVVVLRKHKKKDTKEKATTVRESVVSPAVANPVFSPGDDHLPISLSRGGQLPSTGDTQDQPDYCSTTSVPGTTCTARSRTDANGYDHVVGLSSEHYTTPGDNSNRKPNGATPTVSYGKHGKGDYSDEYNKLSFESAKAQNVSPGAGNHDHLYDSRAGQDNYNSHSFGAVESPLPASTGADYDHVRQSHDEHYTSPSCDNNRKPIGATPTISKRPELGQGKGDYSDKYNKLSFEPSKARTSSPGTAGNQDHLYDTRAGQDNYNSLSLGAKESPLQASIGADYDHVQKQ